MLACAFLSMAGFVVMWCFVPTNFEPKLDDERIFCYKSLSDRIKSSNVSMKCR